MLESALANLTGVYLATVVLGRSEWPCHGATAGGLRTAHLVLDCEDAPRFSLDEDDISARCESETLTLGQHRVRPFRSAPAGTQPRHFAAAGR